MQLTFLFDLLYLFFFLFFFFYFCFAYYLKIYGKHSDEKSSCVMKHFKDEYSNIFLINIMINNESSEIQLDCSIFHDAISLISRFSFPLKKFYFRDKKKLTNFFVYSSTFFSSTSLDVSHRMIEAQFAMLFLF